MGIKKITPVERVWNPRNTKSKRTKKEEWVPELKNKKTEKTEVIDKVEITGETQIEKMQKESDRIYQILKQKDLEEKRKKLLQNEKEEER